MLTFYGWATPNSQRVAILLEELGLAYAVRGVNIRAGEQHAPEIRALNPYGKVPILVDDAVGEREVLFESGAILMALAERHGRFLPTEPARRGETLVWLMVALTSLGPMTGQAHHWTTLAPEKPEAARAHHVGLVGRVYRTLEARLAAVPHLGGEDYSIADIAAWPWIVRHGWAEQRLEDYPALHGWFTRIGARPAVQRGMQVPTGAKLD